MSILDKIAGKSYSALDIAKANVQGQAARAKIDDFLAAREQRKNKGPDRSAYFTLQDVVLPDEDGVNKTYKVPFDHRTGKHVWEDKINLSPKDPTQRGAVSEAKASGTLRGTTKTQATIDLPAMKSDAGYLKSLLDKAVSHPGFEGVVGAPSVGKGAQFVSGTPEAGFRALQQQIEGKQFMEAYKTLKGGGQITEIEGRKATDALSRIRSAVSEDEYITAVAEFKTELDRLVDLAEQKAGSKKPVMSDDDYNARKKRLGLR